MDSVTERSCAKLNLSLDVFSRREDGYHDLKMVMCSAGLCDTVTVTLRTDARTEVWTNFPWLPRDGRNHAVKAAEAFFDALGEKNPGVDIRIEKKVPVGAGMAGGSANAAAVLRALNTLTGAGLSPERLREIGLQVGSDVPYCVSGGMALAQGRGEVLTPLPPMPQCSILICKPSFSISTGDLFRRFDSRAPRNHPDTAGLISALEAGDLSGVAVRMFNVFEEVLPRNTPHIRAIRSALLDAGALGAVMTGTGSAVFGVFDDRALAEGAYRSLSRNYRDCFLTGIENEIFC